jgi:hypothetical protein
MRFLADHFGEEAVSEGECGPCLFFALHTVIRLTTEEKSRESLSKSSQEMPNRSALGTIRCVNLATFTDDLDWPAVLSHRQLALQPSWVNPLSASVSDEFPNKGVPHTS